MAQYCTFYLEDRIFGLDILLIQEIIRLQEITPVPNAPAFVAGLANLRGQIVVAVDLRLLFGLPPRGDRESINIILRSEGDAISLVADKAGDVVDFGEEPIIPPPGLRKESRADLILGVLKLKDTLLHVIDTEAIFKNHSQNQKALEAKSTSLA